MLGEEGAFFRLQPGDVAVDVAALGQHAKAGAEQVELDHDGAAPIVAALDDGRDDALGDALPDMRHHPELGGDAAFAHCFCCLDFWAISRICDRPSRGVSASGSSWISISAGLPAFKLRSKAGANSAVSLTVSPCAP